MHGNIFHVLFDAMVSLLCAKGIDRFELSSSKLELIKDIYLYTASSQEFERLVVSRCFFEEFNLMASRGRPTIASIGKKWVKLSFVAVAGKHVMDHVERVSMEAVVKEALGKPPLLLQGGLRRGPLKWSPSVVLKRS